MIEGKILDIVSHHVPFRVRLVMQGDRYGLNDCLVHDNTDPLVEFFDQRYERQQKTDNGQFVSRYFLSTLIESKNEGILLDTGSKDWFVDPKELNLVKHWAKTHPLVEQLENASKYSPKPF